MTSEALRSIWTQGKIIAFVNFQDKRDISFFIYSFYRLFSAFYSKNVGIIFLHFGNHSHANIIELINTNVNHILHKEIDRRIKSSANIKELIHSQ